jgi:hypothetical protein
MVIMRRKILTLLVAIVLLGVLYRQAEIELDSRIDADAGPWLQQGVAGSMRVHWTTADARASRATLRDEQGRTLAVHEDPEPSQSHRATFSGLVPGRAYSYSVDGGARSGAFMAPTGAHDATVRLWVIGDPGRYGEIAQRSHAAARGWQAAHPLRDGRSAPDVLLTTGDNAYTSGRFREYFDAQLQPLASSLASIPYWPAYGNHDARRRTFFRLFAFPEHGESGGIPSGDPRYYAFDLGPLHVVMLDSQSSLRGRREAMLRWLRQDLEASTRRWKLALFHHPPYSHGSNDSDAAAGSDWRQRVARETLLPVLEEHGVHLVLSGHSHSYERSHLLHGHYDTSDTLQDNMILQQGAGPGDVYGIDVDCEQACGTVYVVLGNFSKRDGGPLDHPAMALSTASAGSLFIDAEPARMAVAMVNADGLVEDHFEVRAIEAVP